ncbi:MAG TPA: hypothetical protein VLK28_07985 [Methylomirabilota bacterium]|nr:hypothetical protein [Methylomirabilota bacterium]
MSRYTKTLVASVTLLAAAAAPAWAQVPPPGPTPGTPGVQTPPPAAPPAAHVVEGKVRHVDPVARTVSVGSGWLGFLFSRTLEVGPDTQITVAGKDSSLAAIQEGAKVRAAYESRAGRMVATRIEVLSSESLSQLR